MSAASLRAMIRLERETLDELRQAVSDVAESAAAALGVGLLERVQVVRALRRIADNLQDEMTRILITAREGASSLAFAQVIIEAKRAGIDPPDEDEEDDPDTATRAKWVAAAFAAAWLMVALSSVRRKSDLRRVSQLQDYRLRRIAATEIAHAYGQTMLRAYGAMIDSDGIAKRWDATLDKRTCSVCSSHHGETVGLDEEFRNGDEPGAVHVNCRCVPTLVRIAADKAA